MRAISRLTDTGIEVFDADLESSWTFPMPRDHWVWAVPAAGDSVVYETGGAAVRVDPDGRERWRTDLGLYERSTAKNRVDFQFSADDSQLWVLVPSILDGRAEHDDLIVLDAVTGELRSRRRLPVTGQGGQQFPLRDGRMLVDVIGGEGNLHVLLAGPTGEPHDFGWNDRGLAAVSPDERQFITVNFGQDDLAFHAFPGGEIQARTPLSAFGDLLGPDIDMGEVFLEWDGGYLDDETAIAVITGEHSLEGDWWRHFRVSTLTGEVLGEMGIVTTHPYDLQPLGDGTYVITDTDGTLRRM